MASSLVKRGGFLHSSIKPFLLSLAPLSIQNQHASILQKQVLSRPFTNTSSTNMSSQAFLEQIKARRSIYQLENTSPIDDKKIQSIVEEALLQVPSSFNSQSTRIILLLKAEHEKFWDLVIETIKGIVPGSAFGSSEKRLLGFKAGYGTVLFFEDRATVSEFQAKFSIYADKFPGWATQSDAMAQFAIWTALEAEGLGANLQHYNPIVDQKVTATWNVPESWELNAQLVFGGKVAEAGPKEYKPLEERFKVYGA